MMKLTPKLNANGWDEMFSNKGVRNSYSKVLQTLQNLNPENLSQKQKQAADLFMNQGITFTVYSDDNQGIERIFPFDIIPRIITQKEWLEVESGIKQRLKALNLFLEDIYNEQQHTHTHCRNRFDSGCKRRILCIGRQSKMPQWRKLYAGKQGNHQTNISGNAVF
jgi:uncharacterized circularly permuted ATP-grasp superfamily protein